RVIPMSQQLEAADYARHVDAAQRRAGHGDLVEVGERRTAKRDPFAHHVAVVVVTGDLGVLAMIDVETAELKLEAANRRDGAVQLLHVHVRGRRAGADPGRVPAAGERRPRARADVDREALLAIDFHPLAKPVLKMHVYT